MICDFWRNMPGPLYSHRRKSLRLAISNYMEFYHTERPHQSLGNKSVRPKMNPASDTGRITCRERLAAFLSLISARQPEASNACIPRHPALHRRMAPCLNVGIQAGRRAINAKFIVCR